MRVTLYTKRDCGLCKEAEEVVLGIQTKIPFELDFVDIETDQEAYARYWDRIPVVVVDGEEVAAAPIDTQALRAALTS